jgi:uncharacterized membrane protein
MHICAGMVAMVSGAAAMILRKGLPRHALAGQVFVASMATTATYLAVIKHQDDHVGGGILTFI